MVNSFCSESGEQLKYKLNKMNERKVNRIDFILESSSNYSSTGYFLK